MADGVQEPFRPLATQRSTEEGTTGLEVDGPPPQQSTDTEFKLTKCVTIQTHGQPSGKGNLHDTWMQYLHVSSGRAQRLSELPDNGHVLLCIDIPNQQVYPLPLLITPVKCVYLVTFDLPEGKEEVKKALKAIRDTLKDVYAYSETALGANLGGTKSEVFLVGLQREEKDWSPFSQQLSHMLKSRPYERLIVPSKGDDLYWTNHGEELNIHDNHALLSRIHRDCCAPPQSTRQSLECHRALLQRFKDDPFVLYKEVEAKMAGVVSGVTESSNLQQFLEVLHSFGFIFYFSPPNLAQSENVVVLQPQYLRQLFVQVQKRSKECKWFTTADLMGTAGKHINDKQKWFLAMCTSMGLVIERSIRGQTNHVFVMGLERECNVPEREHYSVDPLLVTYGPEYMVQMGDNYLLPSPLFPAFINNFLKKLQKRYKSRKAPIAMKRHHLHVSVQGTTHIHVVERDSFVEIGLQQCHVDNLAEGEQLKKLQQMCRDIYGIISDSAKSATTSLRLDSKSLQYGFLCHPESTERVDRFGEFDQDDDTLTCSCCSAPQAPTPQQKIWFSNVDHEKVAVGLVHIPWEGGSKVRIRKLLEAELRPAPQSEAQPQSPQPGGVQPQTPQPGGAQPQTPQPGGAQPQSPQPGGVQPQSPQGGGVQPQSPQGGGEQPQSPQGGGEQPQSPQPGGAQPQTPSAEQTLLRSSVADRRDHLKLFRKHVSRQAAGKARAVLEGVELDTPTIDACFSAHPQNDEDAVQEGLTKWVGGKGIQPPTWSVLIEAMDYAGIVQQEVQGLKEKLQASP